MDFISFFFSEREREERHQTLPKKIFLSLSPKNRLFIHTTSLTLALSLDARFFSSYILTRVRLKFFFAEKRDGRRFLFSREVSENKFFVSGIIFDDRLTNLHFLARAHTHI